MQGQCGYKREGDDEPVQTSENQGIAALVMTLFLKTLPIFQTHAW